MDASSIKSCEMDGSMPANSSASKGRKQEIDWGKYGLAEKSSYEPRKVNCQNEISKNGTSAEVKELFDEEGEVRRTICLVLFMVQQV